MIIDINPVPERFLGGDHHQRTGLGIPTCQYHPRRTPAWLRRRTGYNIIIILVIAARENIEMIDNLPISATLLTKYAK